MMKGKLDDGQGKKSKKDTHTNFISKDVPENVWELAGDQLAGCDSSHILESLPIESRSPF